MTVLHKAEQVDYQCLQAAWLGYHLQALYMDL